MGKVLKRVSAGEYPYEVFIEMIDLGSDVQILVGGGTHPHIGAVAVGFWNHEDEKVHIWHHQLPHHKEGELAIQLASSLVNHMRRTVAVSVGIHVDHASKEEIIQLVQNTEVALEKLIALL